MESPLSSVYHVSGICTKGRQVLSKRRYAPRSVDKKPSKVLDACGFSKFSNGSLIDWSDSNLIACGLKSTVYTYSPVTRVAVELHMSSTKISSVAWAPYGVHLAIGTYGGAMVLYDVVMSKKVFTVRRHTDRLGALTWGTSSRLGKGDYNISLSSTLCSGSRDGAIRQYDLRVPGGVFRHIWGHKGEICDLKWNHQGTQLASSSKDNKLLIWDAASTGDETIVAERNGHSGARDGHQRSTPLWNFSNPQSTTQALTWSPHAPGLLASAGGINSRTIRTWNTTTGAPLNAVDTESQVCNIAWSKNTNELVSTHGYSTTQIPNTVCIWRYPSLERLAMLPGHSQRASDLTVSPGGELVATAAGDETIRFWNAFPKRSTNVVEESDALDGQWTIR